MLCQSWMLTLSEQLHTASVAAGAGDRVREDHLGRLDGPAAVGAAGLPVPGSQAHQRVLALSHAQPQGLGGGDLVASFYAVAVLAPIPQCKQCHRY